MDVEEVWKVETGEAVEGCAAASWTSYCAQHYPGMSRESVWANEVKKVLLNLEMLKGGRVRIQVTVEARQPWRSETYWYQFQEMENGMLVYQGGA